jgi:subtilisin family serine protease
MTKKSNKDLGIYLYRSGKKIKVTKEEDVFTARIKEKDDIKRLNTLPGVNKVELLNNGIYKVSVDPITRDTAMDTFRAETDEHIAHHAYVPEDSKNTRYYITDKIAIKFKKEVKPQQIEKILKETKTNILKEYRDSPNTFIIEVTKESEMNPIKVSNFLSEMEEVEYAEPNLINRYMPFYEPIDDLFHNQWHLKSWNGPQLIVDADVSATKAWDITKGDRSTGVAIVDDGIDIDQNEFKGVNKIIHPRDFVNGDNDPFPEEEHDDYHGTPCAGVAVAEENGEGVVGIAPGCSLMPIRFPLERGNDDIFMRELFNFVGQRADVISCSWGPLPAYAPLSSLVSEKIHQIATIGGPRGKGCVIVFAAGNYNCPLKEENGNTIYKYTIRGIIREATPPIENGEATHPDVIAVASSTSINRKALYSNWGNEIFVCAPSNNFHPIDRSIAVVGRGITTTDNEERGSGFTDNSVFTDRFGGTSSACPLVAGVAALIISANPNLTAKQVKKIIRETADKIIDEEIDPILNANRGNYDTNGHSKWFGYGKINAYKAVKKAKELI